MVCMAKDRKTDRHPRKPIQLRLHAVMLAQLDALVQQHGSDRTEEIRIAIREKLERAGLWPPPAAE